MPRIALKGVTEGATFAQGYARGLARASGIRGYVGSNLPYAYGIEEGRHRKSGKLARRAGGAKYLARAIATMQASADADISEGLTRVRYPGPWVIKRLTRWARRVARLYAPVQTGALRRSIRAIFEVSS